MVDWKRTRYLYRGRGLLEVVGPMGRGVAGSGWFRVGEQVFEGGGIREVCPVTVGLLCTGRLSRLFLSMCNRGFRDLLSVRPSLDLLQTACYCGNAGCVKWLLGSKRCPDTVTTLAYAECNIPYFNLSCKWSLNHGTVLGTPSVITGTLFWLWNM